MSSGTHQYCLLTITAYWCNIQRMAHRHAKPKRKTAEAPVIPPEVLELCADINQVCNGKNKFTVMKALMILLSLGFEGVKEVMQDGPIPEFVDDLHGFLHALLTVDVETEPTESDTIH